MKEKVLQSYTDGSAIELISECFGVSEDEIKSILLEYKEKSRYKNTFTDEFRIMIAERDMNNVARSKIAQELEINVSTVKKSCEKFGNALKEKATSDNLYSLVEGVKDIKTCPNCKRKRVNEVESVFGSAVVNGIFCMDCSNEHLIVHKYEEVEENGVKGEKYVGSDVYKVNFEYLEE